MDVRDIHQLANQYDGIMCGFCIPYLSKEDLNSLLIASKTLLKSNGIAYFSCIEGAYEKSGFESGSTGDRSFVYYYQEDFIRGLCSENGLVIADLFRMNFEKSNGIQENHILFIAKIEA
jgi:predicted TPR repeat methyltransferase